MEYTQRIPELREEVDEAINDFQSVDNGLSGHEGRGAIVSTPVHRQISLSEHPEGSPTDWLWLPEWAVDNDYYTAWRGIDWDGFLVIDLGLRYSIDEIAIAWKYAHKAPGFRVYASNDARVMMNPPESSAGWAMLAIRSTRWVEPPQMWDIVELPLYKCRAPDMG